MAFIPTAGCVRVDLQFDLGGQQCHNILWVSKDSTWTQAEREALNTAIKDWWHTTARSKFTTGIALQQVTSVNQETQEAPSSTLIVSPQDPGTVSDTGLPNNVAMCATLRTGLRGRSYRGRMYLGGFGVTHRNGTTTWTTTAVADIITVLTALKTVIEGLAAVWVIVSHYHLKAPRATGLKTPITAVAIDQYMDSQRRRLALRGV